MAKIGFKVKLRGMVSLGMGLILAQLNFLAKLLCFVWMEGK